jgi:hypothetical protein
MTSSAPQTLTADQALAQIADMLDGRVINSAADFVSDVGDLVRRTGRPVRDPEDVEIRCPVCGTPDITLRYEALVSVRVSADRVRSIVLNGFTGVGPSRLSCNGCEQEFDLPASWTASALDPNFAAALVVAVNAGHALVPDRYEIASALEGEDR